MIHNCFLPILATTLALPLLRTSSECRDVLDCGAYSSTVSTSSETDVTPAVYDTCEDAKRAAKHGLKVKVVAQTGFTCAECAPPDCFSGVYYWDPGQLTAACYFDAETGKYYGIASWAGGNCQIFCTVCP